MQHTPAPSYTQESTDQTIVKSGTSYSFTEKKKKEQTYFGAQTPVIFVMRSLGYHRSSHSAFVLTQLHPRTSPHVSHLVMFLNNIKIIPDQVESIPEM